ncbi:MAG: hypothetical protein ACOCSL_04030 [Thermoplasmatota archaeon]
MDNKKVRGSIINGYLAFIEKKWGRFGKEQCLEDLSIDGEIKDGYYYPNKIKLSVLDCIKDKKGERYIEEAGSFLVKNLGTLSWLVKDSTPLEVAKKIEEEYNEIYTFGEFTIKGNNGYIKIQMEKQKEDDLTCVEYKGILKGILDKTDHLGSVKIKSCGDNFCEYEVKY